MARATRKKYAVEVGAPTDVAADDALAMISDSTSGVSGYTRKIRDIILRKNSQDKKYFLIDIKNTDGSSLLDKKLISNITTWVNVSLKKKGTPSRIRWIETNPKDGSVVNKFLCIPADKYKEFVGGR